MLILLSGVSGSGKTTLINDVLENGQGLFEEFPRIGLQSKYTTRAVQPKEMLIKHVDNIGGKSHEFVDSLRNNGWVYEFEENIYGISKAELDKTIQDSDIVLMTVKDAQTADGLKQHYSGIKVVSLYLNPFTNNIERLKMAEGREEGEKNKRIKNIVDEAEKINKGTTITYIPLDDIENNNAKFPLALVFGTSSLDSFIESIAKEIGSSAIVAQTRCRLNRLKNNDIKDPRELGVVIGTLQSFAEGNTNEVKNTKENISLRIEAGDAVCANIDRFYDFFDTPPVERKHLLFKQTWPSYRKALVALEGQIHPIQKKPLQTGQNLF